MIKLTQEKIKEIFEQLDCGFKCFYNKDTGEIKSFPDFDSNPYAEEEPWQDEIDEVESNFDKYVEFEKMQSRESFQVMADFVDIVDDLRVKKRLIDALNKSKPFRHFKYAIDTSGEYRQLWFKFKEQEYFKWIEGQAEGSKDLEELRKKEGKDIDDTE